MRAFQFILLTYVACLLTCLHGAWAAKKPKHMWAKRFRRANRNARNRPVNNEETEEQGPTNEVTLENVLKLAGNTALTGMHARKLKAANAAADKLVYHRVMTNDEEFDLFNEEYLKKFTRLFDNLDDEVYDDDTAFDYTDEDDVEDMLWNPELNIWKEKVAGPEEDTLAAALEAQIGKAEDMRIELELEIDRAEDVRLSVLRDEERLLDLWGKMQAKPAPKRPPMKMKPRPAHLFGDRKLDADSSDGGIDGDSASTTSDSYFDYETVWQEWISWFASGDSEDSAGSGSTSRARRLAPKPKPPSKLFPERPTEDDVDSGLDSGAVGYAVASHGSAANSTTDDAASSVLGENYDASSTRSDYKSGNFFNDNPVVTGAIFLVVSLALAALLVCCRSKRGAYTQAGVEDTTHNDSRLEMLEAQLGAGAGAGAGENKNDDALMPAKGSGEYTKESPFLPNRLPDTDLPPTDSANANIDNQDNELPFTATLVPLDVEITDRDGLHNESPARDSSVWGWGKAAIKRLLWGGVEYKLAPGAAEMVFGDIANAGIYNRSYSSSSPSMANDQHISTNVTNTVSVSEDSSTPPIAVELNVTYPLHANTPKHLYNLSDVAGTQMKDFLAKSVGRRISRSSSSAGTTSESALSVGEGQESPHSRSKCASLRAFTSYDKLDVDADPLEGLVATAQRVAV